MDLLKDQNLSLKLFVEFLSEERRRPSSTRQDWDEMAKNLGDGIYREILLLLTQKEFEPEEARRHWFQILEHRDRLRQALGRDLGIQVTVCDYFTNVNPTLKDLVLVDVHSLVRKERSALVDELTGLYNRRFFNKILHKELENARRFGHDFALLMLDVDRFKAYNDTFGHPAGDRALKELAGVLSGTARTGDHLVRYGGEEFVIILPRSNKEQALQAAERIRRAVEDHYFPGQESLVEGNLTVTIGVAAYPADAEDGLDLLARADEALYAGKVQRNRVCPAQREKRLHARFPLIREMALRLMNDAEVWVYSGETRDISLGGVKCQVPRPVAVGRPLDVVLAAPDQSDRLDLSARVVRLDKSEAEGSYYLGLQFHGLSPDQEAGLRRLIPVEKPVMQ
ncbi:MAG: diguanylate cyclase [Thermodesulfobacteriota bacterium]